MITPRFSCSQTHNSVIISIYCPSIRAADVEINVDDTLVTIHVNPYYLRLNFTHAVTDDDDSSAQYDPSAGVLTVTLTKQNKGQEFKDLDLLAKLLAPRPTAPQPVIEVLSDEETLDAAPKTINDDLSDDMHKLTLEREEILRAAENDWQLPQEIPEALPSLSITPQKNYGFLEIYSGYFKHVTHVENEVNELGADAETCPVPERRQRRINHENQKWDEEHYMADYADDEYIRELLGWEHPHLANSAHEFQYTEDEKLAMLSLPRKEYLATPIQQHDLYLTLITLIFSYAYESRTTQCDPTSESAWTICSLTPAFSALDPPRSSCPNTADDFAAEELSATLVPSYRRSLAFPLYRSFALAEACQKDIARLFLSGKRMLVRCLLEVKHILDHHDVYYVYSKIWVDDFCTWVQAYASDEVLSKIGNLLMGLKVDKNEIGWGLVELEEATKEALERESDSDDESGDSE